MGKIWTFREVFADLRSSSHLLISSSTSLSFSWAKPHQSAFIPLLLKTGSFSPNRKMFRTETGCSYYKIVTLNEDRTLWRCADLITLDFWILGHKQEPPSQRSWSGFSSSFKQIVDCLDEIFIMEVAFLIPRVLQVNTLMASKNRFFQRCLIQRRYEAIK